MSNQDIQPMRNAFVAFMAHQRLEPGAKDDGAYIHPEWQLADPSQLGTGLLCAAGVALAAADGLDRNNKADYFDRLHRAVDFMLRVQRPSGLIDLLSANFDSAPDTAFTVQLLCAALELSSKSQDLRLIAIRNKVITFVQRAVPGLIAGGFHTPNHRWVVASALAMAKPWADVDVMPTIKAYIAEGPDADSDGIYPERSAGVYDAVTNRAFLLLYHYANWSDALAPVKENLLTDLHLFHADGTIESGHSHRQDAAMRTVPTGLADCYAFAASTLKPLDARVASTFAAAAAAIKQAAPSRLGDCLWQAWVEQRDPNAFAVAPAMPKTYRHLFAANQFYRARENDLSISIFGGRERFMRVVYRDIDIAGVSLSCPFFGIGRFTSQQIITTRDGVRLKWTGQTERRPAYELPLGQRVAPADVYASMTSRRQYRVAPLEAEVKISIAEGQMTFAFRVHGFEGVPAQLAIDLPAVGTWQSELLTRPLTPGSVIFHESGMGQLTHKHTTLRIGPGAFAHRMNPMRDSTPGLPDHARLLLTYLTPIDTSIAFQFS